MISTITVYVNPNFFRYFIKVINALENLNIDNNYEFEPRNIQFLETRVDTWYQINMPIDEYLKLKYSVEKMELKKENTKDKEEIIKSRLNSILKLKII